ncbi:transglycosylase domain-containing protein [Streptomyces lavendofoliae]|uniref:transglycosylase domain-containing protein n=1 Tax=Streptomyces lavendofoliae TaxID=67314 RepID=UPI00167500C7|nr:transglycosylase domain-containing protein [Streptomyces lavendofoliae]
MSEHRRKPPQPQGGGRAAARRAAQQPSGRRAAQARGASTGSPADPYGGGEERAYGSRAEARRAAQRGGRRRGTESAVAAAGGRGARGGVPGKKRLVDYPRHDKYGWRRWVPSWKLVTGLSLGFMVASLGAATVVYSMVEVPQAVKIATAQNNVYLYADGTQMAATGGEINRQILDFKQIPKDMQNAVVSAENKTFWDDKGVDPKGIGRAFYNMAMGEQTQGGSTITQQYVKNAMLDDQSQTISRKAKELFISLKAGMEGDKEEVMAGYLNTSYYGRGAYGIQAAARTYYEKDAKELNASQCAFLAALLKGATYYDPAGSVDIDPRATPEANTTAATKRWKWILDEMVKDRRLDAAERAKYTEFPMPQPPKKEARLSGQVGYMVDLAKAFVINNNDVGITAKKLAQGGYEIRTTFEKPKVEALKRAVEKVEKANIDPEKRPDTDSHVQFGGASVNPRTGAIVAIYGGSDATKHFTNNADQTGAQVGSTFKPFVLAAAMEYGVRDPAGEAVQGPDQRRTVDPDKTYYNGQNKLKIKKYDGSVWHNEDGEEWLQVNDGDQSYGDINLREAMIHSANSPFVQLGMDVGIEEVRQTAIKAGLRKESLVAANVPSFSIGISDPSAIRMAGAYATFAANGKQRDPFSVTEVRKRGETIFKHEAKTEQAFSSAIASNVTDVLKDVVEDPEGTGNNAAIPGREVAGKTGTTDGNKSAWFVGYTPQLATAIDMYRMDDNAANKNRKFLKMFGTGGQQKIHGSSFPSEIWQKYMSAALKGQEVERFPEPEPLEADTVYGGGAKSPEPTPSDSPSPTPSQTPSQSPSPTPSKSESSKPAEPSCGPFDWDCNNEDGGQNGGQDGGQVEGQDGGGGTDTGGTDEGGTTTGGVSPSPSVTTGGATNGNGNGGGNGGWFGGTEG